MSVAADFLAPLVVRDLHGLYGRSSFLSIPDAIISPTAAYDLAFDKASGAIVADFRDPEATAAMMAGDACRLASAAFQTLASVDSELSERDNVAWGLVKLYYGAFYAGNALIRLFGESGSFFHK